MNWWKKFFIKSQKNHESLKKSLEKSSKPFFEKLSRVLIGKTKIDQEVLDEIEDILISADVGVYTTIKIIKSIEKRTKSNKYTSIEELNSILREVVNNLLITSNNTFIEDNHLINKPYIIMVVGINGVGKTTIVAKLANQFKSFGKKVLLGAADTFRPAAIDQLTEWSNLIKVPIIKKRIGSDPGSVVFNTVHSAIKNKLDIVLIDTAGRLHNNINLMHELSKIQRVIQKLIPNAPHEIVLVLDGSTGQNAFEQAKKFIEAVQVSCFAVTKLDGTAKGGVVIGISDKFKIPIKYIGIGEKVEDIELFNPSIFIESFFKIK